MLEVDAALKDVIVVFVEFLRRIWLWQTEQVAQFVGEHLEVRRFRTAGFSPARDESADIGGGDSVVGAVVR